MNTSVSIIIPTYNGVELLQKNLPHIFDAARAGDEIIIVDDASCDESIAWLTKEFGLHEKQLEENSTALLKGKLFSASITHKKSLELVVFANDQNVRFGAAANIGVELAHHELIFLCNNDVIPQKHCLDTLVETIRSSDSIFAVGCLEYLENATGVKSGKNKLWFERGLFQHSKASDFKSGETAWASGGSALFDRSKWLILQGFDKAYYPAYWEDIDLSFRARQKGWQVLFAAGAVVFHKHESTNSTVFGQEKIARMSWKNAFIFSLKHSSLFQKISFFFWLPYWLIKIFS